MARFFHCQARTMLDQLSDLKTKVHTLYNKSYTMSINNLNTTHSHFLNLQEEMLLETNRDLRRKVAIGIFYRKKLKPFEISYNILLSFSVG